MIFKKTQASTMMIQKGKSYFLKPTSHASDVMRALDDQRRRQDKTLCDVTLIVDGSCILAHKAVLAACSSYFNERFAEKNKKKIAEFNYTERTRVHNEAISSSIPCSILSPMSPPSVNSRRKTTSESSSESSTTRSSSSSPVSNPSPNSVEIETRFPFHYSSFIKNEEVIVLPGISSKGFLRLLDYMYTCEMCINEDNVFDIILISCLLQIRTVIEACRLVLSKEPSWKLVSPDSRPSKKRMYLSSWNSRTLSRRNKRSRLMTQYEQQAIAHIRKYGQKQAKSEEIALDQSSNQENLPDCNRIPSSEFTKNCESTCDSDRKLNREDNLPECFAASDKSANQNNKEINVAVSYKTRNLESPKVLKSFNPSITMTNAWPSLEKSDSSTITTNAYSHSMRPKSNSAGPYSVSRSIYETTPFIPSVSQRKFSTQRRNRTVSENLRHGDNENIALDLRQKPQDQKGCKGYGEFFKTMLSQQNVSEIHDSWREDDLNCEKKNIAHRELKRRHLRSNSDEAIHSKSRRFDDDKQCQRGLDQERQLSELSSSTFSENSSLFAPMATSLFFKTSPPFFQFPYQFNVPEHKDFQVSYSTLMLPKNYVAPPEHLTSTGSLPIYPPTLLYPRKLSSSDRIALFSGQSAYGVPHYVPPRFSSAESNVSDQMNAFQISRNSTASPNNSLQQTPNKAFCAVPSPNEDSSSIENLRNSDTKHLCPSSRVESPTSLYNLSNIKHLRKRKLLMSTAMADSGTDTESVEGSSVDSGLAVDHRKERFRSTSLEDIPAKSPC